MKTKMSILIVFIFFVMISCKETKKETVKQESKTEIVENNKGQSGVVDNESAPNALQVAESLEDFTTLVVAIKAASVEDALVNVGPLTVFAPVNSAFDKLPEGTVEGLLKPESKSQLAFILKNHVAPANYTVNTLEKNVRKNRKLYMASGKYLEVTQQGKNLFVGGTKILKSVKVSNGWIHVIGDVLVPSDK
jgi:uncharacterized surface protein with fasciclin (FAS1) repeats